MRASHYSRETFVQVSHNVRANFNQLYFSQLSLEIVAYLSHCALSARGWRRVRHGLTKYAMTWWWFCDDFCRTKKYYMFKTLEKRSQRVSDACQDFAIPCERFMTVRDGLANRFANPSRTRRITVR